MTETKTKKQKIIQEAAARLFKEKGYPATSVRDLAKAVDLKPSSLYNHIASKEEVLQEICFETAQAFLNGIDAIEAQTSGVKDKVEALIRLHIQMAIEDISSVTSFNDEWRHLSEPHLSEFKQMRKDYENRFKQLIKQGIAEGIFADLNPDLALYTLLSGVRWVYDLQPSNRKMTLDELTKQVTMVLMTGLIK